MNCSFALVFLLAAGCRTAQRNPSLEWVQRSQPLLGTFVTISAYGPDKAALSDAVSAAFEEIHRADALMSIHRQDSELSFVNKHAALRPVRISDRLFEVIFIAQQIARETDGAFDVTIRPLADLWGFIWKEYRLPTKTELAATLPRVNYRRVRLNSVENTISFSSKDISIDLGGIGKGAAVDMAICKLLDWGVTNAMVRAGGDLRVIGAPPGRQNWTVQIEDPRKKGQRIEIPLRDAALSTSGNYENFFVVNGRSYSHILNPQSGLPVETIAACTVIAPTCTESDAWATACFVYGVEKSLNTFGQRFPIRFVLMPENPQPKAWPIRQTASFPKSID